MVSGIDNVFEIDFGYKPVMPLKIALMQRIVCHYQMPCYLELDKALAVDDMELKIFAGIFEDKGYRYRYGLFSRLKSIAFTVGIGGLRSKLVVLLGLFHALREYAPDVIISEDISAMPNCLTIWLYAKLTGKPYLIWGPGSIPNRKPSRVRWFIEPLIALFRKGCRGFICYSSYAQDYYYRNYKIEGEIAYNSTAPRYLDSELNALRANISRKYMAENGFNLVFIGGMLKQKRIDVLLQALALLDRQCHWHLDLVGDGPERAILEALAKRLGIYKKIRFHGQIRDARKKEEIFLSAHLGVLPGLGGLAIQELMRYGIPIVSSWADGTEQDLVRNSGAGIFVPEVSPESMLEAILTFRRMSPHQKISLGQLCVAVIDNKYNIDSMVSAVKKGVQRVI
jgi:glycosyltransferase involved in cell wall biosynthesis